MMTWDDDLAPPTVCARCGQPPFATAWYVQDGFVCAPCREVERAARIAEQVARMAKPRDLPRQRTSAGLCWDDAA